MSALRKTCTASISKTGTRKITARVSTEDFDRDRDRITQRGVKVANFGKNPVITAYHDYRRPPVGRALNIRVTTAGLEMEIEFTPPELNPEGAKIGEMYADGWMNSFSIGFQPLKWVENELGGRDYIEIELLEVAAVVVPANPGALVIARSKGLDLSPFYSSGPAPSRDDLYLELADDDPWYLEIAGELPKASPQPDVFDVDLGVLAQAIGEAVDEALARKLVALTGKLD